MDCTFDASLKNTTTFWGEETSDEMCYGFFAYYPQIRDFTFCGQIKSVGVCGKKAVVSDRCDLPTFLTNTNYLPTLCSANCSNSNCTKALNTALNTGCQRDDDVREFIYQRRGSIFLDVLAKCALVQPPASTVCTTPAKNQAYSHRSLIKSYSGSILLVAFVVYIRQF